ncbi:MAG: hypothetical protein KDA61_20690, partial [Planctomycetales bacterium]|nr:hypothetical protein [Planctomycetales bacterium]
MQLRLWGAIATLLALFCVGEAVGEDAHETKHVLDVIPGDAAVVVAIRDAADLSRRGDELIDKTKVQSPFRLTELFRWLTDYLGISKGLDSQGGYALMLLASEPRFESLVLAVPIGDLDELAANFRITVEQLTESETFDLAGPPPGVKPRRNSMVRYLAVRNKHLLLAIDRKCLESAVREPSLRSVLKEGDQRSFEKEDAFVFANLHRAPGARASLANSAERLADASTD